MTPEDQNEDPILCIHRRPHQDCAECLADEYVEEPPPAREFINGGW